MASLRVLHGVMVVGLLLAGCAASDASAGGPDTTQITTTTERSTTTETFPDLILDENSAYRGRATTYLSYRVEIDQLVVTNLSPASYLAGDVSRPTEDTLLIAEIVLSTNSEGRTDNPDRIIRFQTADGQTFVPIDFLDEEGNPSDPRMDALSTSKGILTFPYSGAPIDGSSLIVGELGRIPATISLTSAIEPVEPEPFRIPLATTRKVLNLQAPSKVTCNFEFDAQVLAAGIVLDGIADNRRIRARPDERFLELDLEVTNHAPNGRPVECGPMTGNDIQLRLIVDGKAINQINALDFRPIDEGETAIIRSYFLLQPGPPLALRLTNLIGSDIVSWNVTIPEELPSDDS